MLKYTLRQLQYLVCCVETGSIAAAAERINVSQPTVSAGIAKLEAELGVQLLLRHHAQGVTPTANADRLMQSARSLLSHAVELQRIVEEPKNTIGGEVRLGSFISLAPTFLPRLIAELKTTYPDLRLRLGEGTQLELIEGLLSGHHELALLYDIGLPAELRSVELMQAEPYILLPATHPAAGQKTVSLHQLVDEPLILLDVPPSRDYFTGILQSFGIDSEPTYTSPSLELVRGMVGQGLGYSLLVTRPSGDLSYDGKELTICTIQERVEPAKIVLASLRAFQPTLTMIAFEEFAAMHFRNV